MRRLPGALLAVLVIALGASGESADPRLRDADLAWERGDYPTALNGYLALLTSSAADDVFEAIALQTGELYRTIELTGNGGAPRFAPGGKHFTYEVGRGVGRRTRLAATAAPSTPLAELPGYGAAFSPDGSQVAYLKLAVTGQMLDLQKAIDLAEGTERARLVAGLADLTEPAARIIIRDLANHAEREIDTAGKRKNAVRVGAGNFVLFTGSERGGPDQVYAVPDGQQPVAVTSGDPGKILNDVNAGGTAALFTYRPQGRRGGSPPAAPRFGLITLPHHRVAETQGAAPAFSADGRTVAYVSRSAESEQLMIAAADAIDRPQSVRSGVRLDAPALSPDGSRIVFQMMTEQDWELYVVNRDGTGEQRLTREIQHDVAPRFLGASRILGLIGEPRHRRSYIYDAASGTRTRVFHNNTVRTIAPEYEWVPSADGSKLLIVSERDGDTVSPERGVYLVDLSTKITRDELRARLRANLAAELALRANGRRMFAPIADSVRAVVSGASPDRILGYEQALFAFDSKHITKPGNALASKYLFDTYASFGYAPEYQWFSPPDALDGRTANVIATLKGTVNPELVYVVSSHYDSVEVGPGADDDSSGTAALLETARLLAKQPQPATIVFASFTGEEAGLLGSREFVRRAVAEKLRVKGALNNDMIGWTNDNRLDDTIRYSNPGIRDVQHAAAMQFSNLITYDALYYKNTDAHAYYDAYGDIVGGIGSYPVLGSPHYHQPHDTLDTVNHQLVTEVARTTTATLMLLASSPSRVKDLKIASYRRGVANLTWTPNPETGIAGYLVAWGPPGRPDAQQLRVTGPGATVKAAAGSVVSVKAINARGLEGWDWSRTTVRTGSR